MHKRVVGAVAAVLFTLMAVMVGIVADLHDRSFPQELRATSSVAIDISSSQMSDEEAFHRLGMLSDRWRLGLVKIAPDLSSDQSGQIFVRVGMRNHLPSRIDRFGDQPAAEVRGPAALTHSFATGEYLITGDRTHIADFKVWLTSHRIENEWVNDAVGTTLAFVVREASFAITLLAAIALMVALALYWLLVKARGRALRVLAGVSTWRIQYEDLGAFLSVIVFAGVLCHAVAVLYIGLSQGWIFVPYYASTLATFDAIVVVVTMVCAVAMSLASWPSAKMLALREPAVTSLRRTSAVLKAATFVLVIASVAPAFAAFSDAKEAAAQQALWKSLSEQMVLTFDAALGESGFERVRDEVGDVIETADNRGDVSLSYTWTQDHPDVADFGAVSNLAMVNQRWLNLMLPDASSGAPVPDLVRLSLSEVPRAVKNYIGPNLKLWTRHHLNASEALSRFTFYRYSGHRSVPMAIAGNGNLAFPDSAIIMVAPKLSTFFNDDFLSSVASTGNIFFTGLGQTTALVSQHGLRHKVHVKRVAEEGILRARFSAYFAWLKGVSLTALVVALVLSAVIGAFLTAMIKARRDFPLRLAGNPWSDILRGRVAAEWAVGAVLTVVVLLACGLHDAAIVTAVAVVGLLVSPLIHVVATRWNFTNVSLRKL